MTNPLNVSNLEEGCMLCLNYFGIFSYPLTVDEVHQYNAFAASKNEIKNSLNRLVEQQKIFRYNSFYLLDDDKKWVEERLAGNARAMKLLEQSKKYVSNIAAFPFVKGIAISGSLSKFYAADDPDIDYFIITEANRLWISRSLLHLFKKFTFLTGHQHYYCMNYFIDTMALPILHRNQYSAIEVATLLPAYNPDLNQEFYLKNKWMHEFLPNHSGIKNFNFLLKDKNRYGKKIIERVLNIFFPGFFNTLLMKITDWKWRKKWKHAGYSEAEYNRAFQTELHISKNHPVDYEKKVLIALAKQKETGKTL